MNGQELQRLQGKMDLTNTAMVVLCGSLLGESVRVDELDKIGEKVNIARFCADFENSYSAKGKVQSDEVSGCCDILLQCAVLADVIKERVETDDMPLLSLLAERLLRARSIIRDL